jgi:radical SAM protein with 4Fe4S-binding SPASM domain
MNTLHGLTNINVELTDECNKDCWMCGRRKREKLDPAIMDSYGYMSFALIEKIALQLPPNIVVQLHNNGEGLLYPRFKEAVKQFENQITNIVTNGKLLLEKSDEIIDNLDTIAISVFENDPEQLKQFEIIEQFLALKGQRKPYTVLRLNGNVSPQVAYEQFKIPLVKRILHDPGGSFNYKKDPTIPEIGICLDFLNHLAINKDGDVSICVRYDPDRLGVLGNINERSLVDIWNSKKRMEWREFHLKGERRNIPLCSYCHFWGVPTK